MAKKFVKATGLHNLFDVSGSILDTTTLKESVAAKANENSIIYITADASDETYAYANGDTYIWTKGVLYGRNKKIIEVTWDVLNTWKTNSLLIPGQLYRITDFVTTSGLENASSASHQFDLIVRANSANSIDENAKAALHSGDTYFADCDLSAWEIKYCFDNDSNKFNWASSSGKGVIYYMKDEFGNEASYDFKNILTVPNAAMSTGENNAYLFSVVSGSTITDGSLSGNFQNNVVKPYVEKTSDKKLKINFGQIIARDSTQKIHNCYVGYNSHDFVSYYCDEWSIGNGSSIIVINSDQKYCSTIGLKIGNDCNTITVSDESSVATTSNPTNFSYTTIGDGCTNITLGISMKNSSVGTGCSEVHLFMWESTTDCIIFNCVKVDPYITEIDAQLDNLYPTTPYFWGSFNVVKYIYNRPNLNDEGEISSLYTVAGYINDNVHYTEI